MHRLVTLGDGRGPTAVMLMAVAEKEGIFSYQATRCPSGAREWDPGHGIGTRDLGMFRRALDPHGNRGPAVLVELPKET